MLDDLSLSCGLDIIEQASHFLSDGISGMRFGSLGDETSRAILRLISFCPTQNLKNERSAASLRAMVVRSSCRSCICRHKFTNDAVIDFIDGKNAFARRRDEIARTAARSPAYLRKVSGEELRT